MPHPQCTTSLGCRESWHFWRPASEELCPASCRVPRVGSAKVHPVSCMVAMRGELGTDRDSQIVATSQFRDLTNVSETCTHHDCLITMLLVVIED